MRKRSKLLTALLAVFLISGIGFTAFAAPTDIIIVLQIDKPIMTVNGREQPIDENGTVPTIQGGRTLLPVRAVAEAMGATVEWNGASQTATLNRGGDVIRLTIGNRTAYLNGVRNTLDTAPVIINGRTMLPIRFIAESFGFDVEWNGVDSTITITGAEQKESENSYAELEVRFGQGGSPFILHLYDNPTAAEIARLVGISDWNLPIYHYDDYENWEVMQYYDIPSRYNIPAKPETITSAKAGEVYYSDPNRIVLFYHDAVVRGEYVKLGYIDYSDKFVAAVENNPVIEGYGNKIVVVSPSN